MARTEQLRAIVEPIVASLDAEIYDLEFDGGALRLTLDRPGGIDLDTIAEATRQVSRQLDLDDPIPGSYTLEVSSPGLERKLRTAAHWETAVGRQVKAKTRPGIEGDRRVDGTVLGVEGDHVTIATAAGSRTVAIDDLSSARTVFVWEPTPKPGGKPAGPRSGAVAAAPDAGGPGTASDPTTAAVAATDESETR